MGSLIVGGKSLQHVDAGAFQLKMVPCLRACITSEFKVAMHRANNPGFRSTRDVGNFLSRLKYDILLSHRGKDF